MRAIDAEWRLFNVPFAKMNQREVHMTSSARTAELRWIWNDGTGLLHDNRWI